MRDFWNDVAFVVRILFGMAVPIVAAVLMVTAFVVALAWVVMGVRDILRRNRACSGSRSGRDHTRPFARAAAKHHAGQGVRGRSWLTLSDQTPVSQRPTLHGLEKRAFHRNIHDLAEVDPVIIAVGVVLGFDVLF